MQDLSESENPEHQAFRERLERLQPFIAGVKPDSKFQEHVFGHEPPDLEEICKTWLEKSRISISRPNQFPGYRSVALFNSMFFDNHAHRYYDSNIVTLVTIASDGRLNSYEFWPAIEGNSFHLSIGEALKLLETNQGKWIVKDRNADMILSGPGSGNNAWLQRRKDHLAEVMTPFKSVPRESIIEYLGRQTGHDFKQARLALRNALDPDVVKIMHGTGLVSIREIKWLTGGDGVPSEIILARKQAIRAYPVLARQFLNVNSTTLRDAIDARTSLSDAIAAYFNLDENGQQRKVRRLQGLTWQRTNADPNDTVSRVRDILNLPEKTVPKTQRQFKQLNVFKNFGKSVFKKSLCQTMERLSKEGNPWNLIDRIERTGGRNVDDAVDFLARKLYIPVMLNKIGMIADHHGIVPSRRLTEDHQNRHYKALLSKAKDTILTSFKTRELLDWSDRYHRNIARYEDRLVTINLEQDWPGISETIEFGDDYVARELTSSKALKIQGRAEDHCVGGYLSSVLKGENNLSKEIILIFSIEKNDKILSTAEIGCIRQPCHSIDSETGRKTRTFRIKAQVIQNLARSNKDPSRNAVRIANQITRHLEQIKPNAWQAYLDGLEHSSAEQDRLSGIDVQIRNCGFDPFDHEMMDRVLTEFNPGLPRHLRRKELDEFIRDIPVGRFNLARMLKTSIVDFHDRNLVDDEGHGIVQKSECPVYEM